METNTNTNKNEGETEGDTKCELPPDMEEEIFPNDGFNSYSRATIGQMYDRFSSTYEQYREQILHHKGTQIMLDYVTRYIGIENKNLRILDVACGTGSVGEALAEMGFQHIDGLDPAPKMLELAREKGVFTNTIESFIQECGPTVVPDCEYDVLVCLGFIGVDHLHTDDFDVLYRITKPGGHVLIIGSDTNWTKFPEYHEQTQTKIDKMAADRKCEVLVNEVAGKYLQHDGVWHNARVILLKRLN